MIKSAIGRNTLRQRGRTRPRTERPPGPQKPAGPGFRNSPGLVGIKPHPQIIIQRKLGKRIKKLRKKRGLTETELAKELGINTLLMGKIERGERNLAIPTIVHLAKVFRTTVADLFRGIA